MLNCNCTPHKIHPGRDPELNSLHDITTTITLRLSSVPTRMSSAWSPFLGVRTTASSSFIITDVCPSYNVLRDKAVMASQCSAIAFWATFALAIVGAWSCGKHYYHRSAKHGKNKRSEFHPFLSFEHMSSPTTSLISRGPDRSTGHQSVNQWENTLYYHEENSWAAHYTSSSRWLSAMAKEQYSS
jgi:hypothetical protein